MTTIERLRAQTELEVAAAGQLASDAVLQELLEAVEHRLAAERAEVDAKFSELEKENANLRASVATYAAANEETCRILERASRYAARGWRGAARAIVQGVIEKLKVKP